MTLCLPVAIVKRCYGTIYIRSWDLVKCPDWEVSFRRGSAGWGNNLHPPYTGSQAPLTAQRIVLTAILTCKALTRIVNRSGTDSVSTQNGEAVRLAKCVVVFSVASFPGLHAQLLSLAVRKAGEGLDGLIT